MANERHESIAILLKIIKINNVMIAWSFLVTQMVKNLSAMQETRVPSLGWEDSLEKGMAIHSNILAWRVP